MGDVSAPVTDVIQKIDFWIRQMVINEGVGTLRQGGIEQTVKSRLPVRGGRLHYPLDRWNGGSAADYLVEKMKQRSSDE